MEFARHPRLQWLHRIPGGSDWLARLPELVEDCCRRWDLTAGEPFAYAFASLALPVVRRDGTSAVLKVQWPDRESEHEADALIAWQGYGAVQLFGYDAERRALLLERCRPGTALAKEPPDAALEVLIRMLPRLWIPAPRGISSLSDEVAGWMTSLPASWEAAGRPIERRLVDAALEIMSEFAPTQGPQVLVHQDLHAENVLRAEREPWLAIDPKPLVGEREFAVACIVRGAELGHSREAAMMRLHRLCEALGLDRERARGWTIAQTLAWTDLGGDRVSARHLEVVRWLLE
ncbi:MAG: aminoglycoside phosphotransferase family protein [Candidatus Dormibacteraeota bacterium]|nr:aminoglycoside phosphotransferase family protein [Candidatus Dormibacteraeota bacterium]